MRPSSSPPGGALPAWLALAGSAFLLVHLAAVGLAALDVPSGPWPGVGFVPAPPFVHAAARPTNFTHVRLLKVGHAFRHYTNRPGVPGAVFEVRLKDDKGQPLTDRRGEPLVVNYPEKDANPWVRHRQTILARQLADDLPVEPPAGEAIAAPGQAVPNVEIWDIVGERRLALKTIPQHLVPRDREVMRPSDWELLLARSFARYLCRRHDAASAEIVRRTRQPVPPAILTQDLPPMPFDELVASYGEVSR